MCPNAVFKRGAHPKGDITSNGNEYSPNFNEFYQILTNFHELTRIRANLLGLTRIDSDFLRFIQFFSVNFENQFESNPCWSKIRIKGEHEFDSNWFPKFTLKNWINLSKSESIRVNSRGSESIRENSLKSVKIRENSELKIAYTGNFQLF